MTRQGYFVVGAGVLWGAGISTATMHFGLHDPWFFVGLVLCVIAGTATNTGFIVCRSRTLEEEYECGYRIGYRDGRKAAPMWAVDGRKRGGIQEAAVRSLASHREASRRTTTHAH